MLQEHHTFNRALIPCTKVHPSNSILRVVHLLSLCHRQHGVDHFLHRLVRKFELPLSTNFPKITRHKFSHMKWQKWHLLMALEHGLKHVDSEIRANLHPTRYKCAEKGRRCDLAAFRMGRQGQALSTHHRCCLQKQPSSRRAVVKPRRYNIRNAIAAKRLQRLAFFNVETKFVISDRQNLGCATQCQSRANPRHA